MPEPRRRYDRDGEFFPRAALKALLISIPAWIAIGVLVWLVLR